MDPNPKQLILNLLLAADHNTLSAREAVGSCKLFGIRENNVRVALVRLSANGLVEATCREYGVKYSEHKSVGAGVLSHFRWLRRLGRPDSSV